MAARPTGEHLRADAPTYLRAVAEEIRRTTPPGDEDAAGLLATADVFDAAADNIQAKRISVLEWRVATLARLIVGAALAEPEVEEVSGGSV